MLQTSFCFTPRRAFAPAGNKNLFALDAPGWKDVPSIGGFHSRTYGGSARFAVDVKLAVVKDALAIRFSAVDPDTSTAVTIAESTKRFYNEWYFDFMEFLFDPRHNHTDYVKFQIDPAAGSRIYAGYALRGESYGDRFAEENIQPEPPGFEVTTRVNRDSWEGLVKAPLALFGEGASFENQWGFQVLRYRPRHLQEAAVWQSEPAKVMPAVMDFGDLYFSESAPQISEIDFGHVIFDKNTLRLSLASPQQTASNLKVRVHLPIEERTVSEENVSIKPKAKSAKVPFFLDFHGRWPVKKDFYQRVFIEVAGKRGSYLASYPVGYDFGIRVDDAYGNPKVKRPKPADVDFLKKLNNYICGRLPWFVRKTTRDGAKSDFVLTAKNGSVSFNLMSPKVLSEIADFIYGLYDNDMDRLLGAQMFFHQRAVTRHSGPPSGIAEVDAAGMLRLGAALCGNRAQALSLFLPHMRCEKSRHCHRSHMLGLAGHVVTLVDPLDSAKDDDHSFEDHLVLDPDIGVLLVSLDNMRVATLRELQKHREISYRANFANVRHGHEFYHATKHQTFDMPRVFGTFPDYFD
jgi:hypothetical protein